ncbi:uncharacterized protein LOC108462186 [Gossypium arboreum]|uniref:uncharacterized protein LOC108462186 n=1 Tax=Gossypium arboreum TaxID=29729 RepID=UPI000819437F|nr:uncharacterized protein LOC108462186 [Gossypium arboreum]
MNQYGQVTDIVLDRITLQSMEKKPNESFRQYAQRWREIATQVQPPLLEKETTMLFINTLKAPFINHLLGGATKSFSDIVISGEMIENAIRCGKIEAGESTKRSVPRKRENEVNNVSRSYAKSITVNQSRIVNASQQASSKQESDTKQNTEKLQFTSIPVTYKKLYQSLFNAHVVSPVYLKPMQPPYPKWYNKNIQYEYHVGITGHTIENYTAFKRLVEKLLEMGIIKFDESSSGENPLPNHADKGVNAVIENIRKRFRMTVAEVRIPLREVWKEIMKRGLITQSSGNRPQKIGNYCKFHGEEDHEIQECDEFRALIQELMDNKELEFFEYVQEKDVCTSEEGSLGKDCEINRPRVIISQSKINEVGLKMAPRIVIQKPVAFPYKDSKRVHWSYNCNVTIPGRKNQVNTQGEAQDVGFHTKVDLVKGKSLMKQGEELLIKEPIAENEAKEFLKFLKHSKYSVVEQLHKQPARISVLTLLLSSETHRNALMKVLNETYIANDITVNKLDRIINNISGENFISLARMKYYRGLPIDSSHIKTCQNMVRAFDGTERKVMGRIEVPLLIGPNTYEDIIASVTSDAPYIKKDDEVLECSFCLLEFVNATFVMEGSKIQIPKMSSAMKMGLQLMVENGALPGKGLEKYLYRRVEVPVLTDKRDYFGLVYEPDAKQRRKEVEKRQERRRARLSRPEVKWEPISFPYISKTFVSGGMIHLESGITREEYFEDMFNSMSINVVLGEESPDINDTSSTNMDPESPFEQALCLEGSQDFEDDEDYSLSPDLLRMTRQDLIKLLREFKDVFAWTYQDIPGLNPNITVHRVPTKKECKPVQQKLRRMRPGMAVNVREEVKKQFDAGFLQAVNYSEWVANVVPAPKKDGKVRMYVDYRDLNKASPNDNFPLPYIDTLVDNTVGYSLFSFIDGFSGYNQIKMHSEDMEKTTFITLWGTFYYKVMLFSLKNAGATFQRAMVTLFHDMMHKEIEVYVNDMIAKSRTENEHLQVLRRLFLRLRKFQLKLNPTKYTFGARSGKLLGFFVIEK